MSGHAVEVIGWLLVALAVFAVWWWLTERAARRWQDAKRARLAKREKLRAADPVKFDMWEVR